MALALIYLPAKKLIHKNLNCFSLVWSWFNSVVAVVSHQLHHVFHDQEAQRWQRRRETIQVDCNNDINIVSVFILLFQE